MSGGRKSSKIYIPHTEDEGCNIVGILEQLDADDDTQGRPIALVQSSPSAILFQDCWKLNVPLLSSSSTVTWGIAGFSPFA